MYFNKNVILFVIYVREMLHEMIIIIMFEINVILQFLGTSKIDLILVMLNDPFILLFLLLNIQHNYQLFNKFKKMCSLFTITTMQD